MNYSKIRNKLVSSIETIQPFEAALEIFYRELEANDPKVVEVHEKLSLLLHGSTFDLRSYKREGKTSGPQHARLALAKRESFLSEKFFLLTPTERMNFQRKHRPFDFLAMYSNDEELANAVLRHKGIVLDSELEDEIFRKLFAKRKPSGKTYLDLREEQLELLELFSQNIQFTNPAKKLLKILLHNLQNDYLEDRVHWLKENIGPIKRRALSVNQEQVRNALPENACLIEFFKFSDYGLETMYRIRAEPAYGAFILGKTEKPKYIYCGPADWIEENTDEFIRWSQNSKQGALPNVAVHNVYKSVMQPILAELPEGTEKIIISPDGKLNFLPFSALYRKDSIFNFHWAHYFLVLVTYLAVIFFVLVRLKRETLGKRISPLVFTLLSLEALWLIFELIKGIQNFGKSPLSDLYLIPSLTIGILYRFALSQNSYKFSQQIIAFTSLTLIFGILRTSSYFQDFDYDYLIGKEGLLHSVQAAGISLLDRAVILAVYFIPLWVVLRLVAKLLGSKTILCHFILLSVCSFCFVLWIEYALIFWDPVNATALSKCALVIFLLYFGWLLVFEARKEKYGFQPILGKITPALSITLLLCFLSFKMEPSMFVWEQGQPGPLLCEKYDISYVSTGRDLLDEFQQPKKDKKALVLGNPKYLLKEKMETLNEEALAYSIENTTSNLNIIRSLNFTSLPGTQTEVEKLTQLLEKRGFAVTQLMGQEASEKNLYIRAFEQPQILHFATHGFFVGNRKKLGDDFGQVRFFGFERENNETIDNPMKRAGLALSGAKSTFEALAENHQIIETNDGIVTAKEAAAINLEDNWLTALSACETGAGESQDGEGVLGLRRAFAQAGTKNLLLTLWPVDDNKTVDFMQAFYEEALKTGNAPGALAKVQREFLVKYRKEESLSRAIRYFAPFILTFRGALPE
ncbi:MAG: CHAT domain-containing protein [Opitutales bacterium]